MINRIISKFPQLTALRLRQSVVTKVLLNGKQIVEITLSNPARIDAYSRAAIEDYVNSLLPSKYISQITFESDELDGEYYLSKFNDFCASKFPSLFYRVKDSVTYKITDNTCAFTFDVDSLTFEAITKFEFLEKLQDYFASITSFSVTFDVKKHELEQSLDEMLELTNRYQELQINRELSKPKRYLSVKDVSEFIGKAITTKPRYIKDLQPTHTLVTVCGKIHDAKLITYKDKKDENEAEKVFLVFTLQDYTASIPVKYFPKKETMLKMEKLVNGDEIIIQGTLGYDNRNLMTIKALNICRCVILAEAEQPKNAKEIPASYIVVTPKRVSVKKQASLEEVTSDVPSYLASHTVVCLSVDTSGNNVRLDKVLRISAVKLIGGMIKESFFTYINPETEIPPEKLKELSISAKSLAEKPVIIDVIPDLYKFCAENTLIVFNADLSLSFIKYYAYACNYDFKYETHDILDLSAKFLPVKEQSAVRMAGQNVALLAEKLQVQDVADLKDKAVIMSRILVKMLQENDKLL